MGFSAKQVQALLRRKLDHRYVRTREANVRQYPVKDSQPTT